MKRERKIPTVGFVSLGCPKAASDAEQILTRLRAEGYEISGSHDGADLVVVQTNNATYMGTGQIEQQFAKPEIIGSITAGELIGKWAQGPLVGYETTIIPAALTMDALCMTSMWLRSE